MHRQQGGSPLKGVRAAGRQECMSAPHSRLTLLNPAQLEVEEVRGGGEGGPGGVGGGGVGFRVWGSGFVIQGYGAWGSGAE